MVYFQFFAILALGALDSYTGSVNINCPGVQDYKFEFDYPFNIHQNKSLISDKGCNTRLLLDGQFGADAGFFFITTLAVILATIVICVLYAKYDTAYKTNTRLPIAVKNSRCNSLRSSNTFVLGLCSDCGTCCYVALQ